MKFPTKRLRYLAKVVNGGTPSVDADNWNGAIPWATPVDLGRVNGATLTSTERTLTMKGALNGSAMVPAGSVILSTRAPIGYTAVANMATAFNQGCKALVPAASADGRFLRYSIEATTAALVALGRGSTFLEVNSRDLAAHRVPTAPIETQREIAHYLDHETAEIDAFIADLLHSRVLTIERTRSFASFQIERGAASATSESILSHVIDVNAGQIDPLVDHYADLPLIAPNHIESRTGRLLYLESARDQGAISGKYKVRAGQVLYSKIRPALMKATIAPCDSLCAADMYAMDARPVWLSNDYLLEYLLSDRFEQYAVTMSDRVAMPKLNRDALGRAPIRIPSADIQARAVLAIKISRRAQFDAIADIDAAIALAKERRAALITAAVTGQIDVTTKQKPAVDRIQTAIQEGR
ncbi:MULTISPECIES: restriction endonuclease subunit S [unclassified Microbacterium]|uniref:restriction endonuclease subunit S n=1 Tax=unclassified Microbacterium TaxID=2609290 RepID=UPI003016261B